MLSSSNGECDEAATSWRQVKRIVTGGSHQRYFSRANTCKIDVDLLMILMVVFN